MVPVSEQNALCLHEIIKDLLINIFLKKIHVLGAGQMVQRLTAWLALPVDLGLIPSTNMMLTTVGISALFWASQVPGGYMVH